MNRSINIIIIMIMIISTISCKYDKDKNGIKKNDFEDYRKAFELVKTPIIIDSTTLVHTKSNYTNLKAIPDSNEFIQELIFQELCGEVRKYDTYAYKEFKVSEEAVGLLYFLKLNPNCILDAYIYRVILVIYNFDGEIIATKEVVLSEELWEMSRYKYCTISDNNILTLENIEITEDFDLDTRQESTTLTKFSVTNKGFIED